MDTLPRGSPHPQDIQSVFDAIDDGPLVDRLNAYRWTGRKGYSPASMWRACLVRYLLRLRYVRDLIAQLRASRPLRRLCGFRDAVPSEGTFSRFIARLVCHQDLVNQIIDDATARVGDALTELHDAGDLPDKAPVPGSQVSIDSTDVPAYGNPRREKLADLEATWGHRTPKSNMDAAGEMFYGYKLHAICDAYYGTPLAWSLLPANANDSPQLPPLMDHILDRLPDRTVRYLMADRGYDGMPNYQYLDKNRILAVIHIKDTDKGSIYERAASTI